jgi:hypothetical protein
MSEGSVDGGFVRVRDDVEAAAQSAPCFGTYVQLTHPQEP